MQFLGLDIGSSSVKAAILDGETGKTLASAFSPKEELAIGAPQPGWAEQHPDTWWNHVCLAVAEALAQPGVRRDDIGAIGISYQMHGLVVLDEKDEVIRPSIIWCDSRAVGTGEQALAALGADWCFEHLLNAPGNFTASKLGWMQQHEPAAFARVRTLMLPGDYIGFRLTGEKATTISGLSEGMFWDFSTQSPAFPLLAHYHIDPAWIPAIQPTFGAQGDLTPAASAQLGLPAGIPVTYRAGDQPNNAFSLRVLHPGEVAATAGTSGVVYGVSEQVTADRQSRVNTFAHVNYQSAKPRLGVLLCINGCGIQYNWARRQFAPHMSYAELNDLAASVPVGAEGVRVLPFGNGAERALGNALPGASLSGIDFNRHHSGHLFRALQEGIVFSLAYGLEGMRELGIQPSVVRAGRANLFLSPLFRQTFATLTQARVELYETDGAAGAARGAGLGVGYYSSEKEAFTGLTQVMEVEPEADTRQALEEAYHGWKQELALAMSRVNA